MGQKKVSQHQNIAIKTLIKLHAQIRDTYRLASGKNFKKFINILQSGCFIKRNSDLKVKK